MYGFGHGWGMGFGWLILILIIGILFYLLQDKVNMNKTGIKGASI